MLEEIIAVPSENDFVTFEVKDVAPIAVTKKYSGVGATVVARIKNTRTPFGIDLGVGDVIVPKSEKQKLPTQLDGFDAPMVNTYSLETTIAEKLDAILNLMEFSSRMKDYYDIYYLANKFDLAPSFSAAYAANNNGKMLLVIHSKAVQFLQKVKTCAFAYL